jgi:DNA-binding NarL/FixJ family response regulator
VTRRDRQPALKVGLLSQHPLVLEGFQRSLSKSGSKLILHRLLPAATLDAQLITVPKASVYVIDAHAPRPTTGALVAAIRKRHGEAHLMFVADKFDKSSAFALLNLGAKALLNSPEAHEQLPRALDTVMAGGYWVPRTLLSGFVDSILHRVQKRKSSTWSGGLSPRELQVLAPLLDNLSNKEIADRLNISERTVKFHVSRILSKFEVRRRADLVLLWYHQNHS